MQTVMFIQVSGKMIRLMVRGSISTWMELNSQGNGSMINNTGMVLKNGLMELSMKVTTPTVKNTVKEIFIG